MFNTSHFPWIPSPSNDRGQIQAFRTATRQGDQEQPWVNMINRLQRGSIAEPALQGATSKRLVTVAMLPRAGEAAAPAAKLNPLPLVTLEL